MNIQYWKFTGNPAQKNEPTTVNVKVSELSVGQQFKLPGQRKWRKIIYIETDLKVGPPDKIGHTLIGTEGCRQMVLAPDREVITPSSEAVMKAG